MPTLEERTDAVIAKLSVLGWMIGYPSEKTQLEIVAHAIARFCQTERVHHGTPDDPKHDDLGDVVPLDWLVREVAATCVRFPAPINWRRVYETRFSPLDGKTATEMEENLGL